MIRINVGSPIEHERRRCMENNILKHCTYRILQLNNKFVHVHLFCIMHDAIGRKKKFYEPVEMYTCIVPECQMNLVGTSMLERRMNH